MKKYTPVFLASVFGGVLVLVSCTKTYDDSIPFQAGAWFGWIMGATTTCVIIYKGVRPE